MTEARRDTTSSSFRSILVSSLAQLILLIFSAIAGWSQPKQDKPEDPFIAQHSQAVKRNPEGVSFTLRTLGDSTRFRQGEIISVEYSFASKLRKTYKLYDMSHDRSGRVHLDKFILDHRTGVVDPLDGYLYPGSSMGGLAGESNLGRKPETLVRDLNQWLRFDQPGKFRLYVTAPRIRKRGEKPSKGYVEITSNIVEFEILPRDAEWEEREFRKIMHLLDSPAEFFDSLLGCHRLRYFNTEAAASEMIRRNGLPPDDCDHEYIFGLIGSPHRAFIVKEMERRLVAPDQIVSSRYLIALSHLAYSLRHKDTFPDEWPREEKEVKAFTTAWGNRMEAVQEIQFRYAERLLSSLPHKREKARAISANTLLQLFLSERLQTGQNGSTEPRGANGINPETIKKLASEIIALFDELPPSIQGYLLGYRWKHIADPAMAPFLRRILDEKYEKPVNEQNYDANELRAKALQRLYELSPDEGRKLILEEMRRPNPRVGFPTLRVLADKTLPEMDETLVENLDKARSGGRDAAYLYSSLIERYATASVLPRVRAIYNDEATQSFCSSQSILLAYFLRVDPAMGIDLIKQAVAGRGPGNQQCYASTLTEVAKLRRHPELETIAIDRLDDPDPKVVADAASMLGEYGSPDAEGPLWRRLEKWLQDWQGRADELMKDYKRDHPNIWHRQVGQALRSALFHSPAWAPDREKIEKLRQAYFDKKDFQDFNRMAGELTDNIQITFSSNNDGWGGARVAHYECNSLPVLKEKLRQFPAGVTFLWNSYGEDPGAAERVFSELETFLEENGMKLEKRKNQ